MVSSLGSDSHCGFGSEDRLLAGMLSGMDTDPLGPWGFIPALHPCSPPSLLSQLPHVSFLRGPEHHQSWGTVVHASG